MASDMVAKLIWRSLFEPVGSKDRPSSFDDFNPKLWDCPPPVDTPLSKDKTIYRDARSFELLGIPRDVWWKKSDTLRYQKEFQSSRHPNNIHSNELNFLWLCSLVYTLEVPSPRILYDGRF